MRYGVNLSHHQQHIGSVNVIHTHTHAHFTHYKGRTFTVFYNMRTKGLEDIMFNDKHQVQKDRSFMI